MRKQAFRSDINGLRAWAVLAVVLFHFELGGFGGGFVGVDVFFVISGFLMTQILVRSLESDGLGIPQLLRFYVARAVRILPALIALVVFVMALGWFALPPTDYAALGVHAMSSLAFVSNLVYWKEANYFDAASHDKWLLHTWSLSVEWQFYMLLPLAFALLWKIRRQRSFLIAGMWVAFALSLALSVLLTPGKPTTAFYVLPTRAWEMIAGGLVFFHPRPASIGAPLARMLCTLGIAIIAAAIFLFEPKTSWPGALALVPVAGAALVLWSAQPESPWTANRLAQWLGDRSYSIYLWHWPFASALYYFGHAGNPSYIAIGLALTAILGHLSFRYIETPSRTRLSGWKRGAGRMLAATAVVAAMPALAIVVNTGIEGRLPARVEAVFNEANNRNPLGLRCHVDGPAPIPGCTYGGRALGVVVIGDSHAASVVRSVEKALPSRDLHVLDWTMSACPTVAGIKKVSGEVSPNCGEAVSGLVAKAATLPPEVPILIVNRYSRYIFPQGPLSSKHPAVYFRQPEAHATPDLIRDYQDGLANTACALAKTHPVYMLRPIPEMHENVPNTMGRRMLLGDTRRVSIGVDEYRARHAAVWAAQDRAAAECGIKLLDPTPLLCTGTECLADRDGKPLYYDDNHLSEQGGAALVPLFKSMFGAQSDLHLVQAQAR